MQLIFFELDTYFNETSSGSNLHQFVSFCIFYISQQNAFATLAWKAFLLSSGILAQASEPKTLRWETLVLYPCCASNGVTPTTDLWCSLLYKYEAQFTASPKEEVDACHGEGMSPYISVICYSSQPHHFVVVCMELGVPFKSPRIHKNIETLFWCILSSFI